MGKESSSTTMEYKLKGYGEMELEFENILYFNL